MDRAGQVERWNLAPRKRSSPRWRFDPFECSPLSEHCSASKNYENLARGRYVGSFRNAINAGGGPYYDISVGANFIRQWHEWKTGNNKYQNQKIVSVTETLRRVFGFKTLEINASVENVTISLVIDGRVYKLPELGSGIAQSIVVFASLAVSQPTLLFIDEPEQGLHPSLQVEFLLSLAAMCPYGIAFSTHSIGLARAVADRLYSVVKRDDGHSVKDFESTSHYAEFLGEMSFSGLRDIGYDRILLVEGVTEVKVFQSWLSLYGLQHSTVILPLGGDQLAKAGNEIELAEVMRLAPNVYAVVDSERHDETSGAAGRRKSFRDSCTSLGIQCHLTERRATENYFTAGALARAFGRPRTPLAPFESLSSLRDGWSKRDNWRVAKAMTPGELDATDLGAFLRGIASQAQDQSGTGPR